MCVCECTSTAVTMARMVGVAGGILSSHDDTEKQLRAGVEPTSRCSESFPEKNYISYL